MFNSHFHRNDAFGAAVVKRRMISGDKMMMMTIMRTMMSRCKMIVISGSRKQMI